jgi:hypothetical protein
MAIDRERARAAGYTDQEIDAYEAAQTQQPMGNEPPPPPPPDAAQGEAGGTSMGEMATTAALAAAPYAVPAALTVGGLYGASVAKRGFDAMKAASEARTLQAQAQMATAQGLQQRAEQRLAAQAARAAPATPQILNASGQPMRAPGPVMPTTAVSTPTPAAPAPAAQPSMMQRGMDYARQMQKIAAEKVMQGARAAAPVARAAAPAAAGLSALVMPSNVGQQYPFPTSGPYRGQEINPMTGRPWTPQELAQYR